MDNLKKNEETYFLRANQEALRGLIDLGKSKADSIAGLVKDAPKDVSVQSEAQDYCAGKLISGPPAELGYSGKDVAVKQGFPRFKY